MEIAENQRQIVRLAGLSEIAGGYDAVLCDIWGVLHDEIARLRARLGCAGRLSPRTAERSS